VAQPLAARYLPMEGRNTGKIPGARSEKRARGVCVMQDRAVEHGEADRSDTYGWKVIVTVYQVFTGTP
jgi:hypothetical protein